MAALHAGADDLNAVRLHVENRCIRAGRFVRRRCRRGWSGYALGSVALQNRPCHGGLAAAVLGLVALFLDRSSRRGVLLTLVTIGLGALVVGIPWQMKKQAQHVPPIHDITTDTENPPAFVAILPLRRDAPNPAEYGGPEVAAQQQKAYPDLRPLFLIAPQKEAFSKALEAARAMGWQIVDSNQDQGRIEATDTTLWFGFKDDIVVRVMPAVHGSRIEVRSVSRVGKSDVGTNAQRIQAYLRKIMQGSTP